MDRKGEREWIRLEEMDGIRREGKME